MAPNAHPRRTVIGSWSAPTRRIASSTNLVVPIPAVPSISSVPDSPALAAWRTDASLVKASSRPTNRALVKVAGITAF
jgi:hypothetical protein